jgi:hypothetical protein
MKKLSINIPEGLGDVLSQEELKHVLGGMGSETGSGSGTKDCSKDPIKVRVCCYSKLHDPCTYWDNEKGDFVDGYCQLWIGRLFCSTLNRYPCRP